MKIHEYQAKELFEAQGIPVPSGDVATTPEQARDIAEKVGKAVMVKAQVHVGGRGKAGGVKYCATPDDAYDKASQILGMDIKGLTVKKVLVTEAVEIETESYVGIILDRAEKKPVMMVSPAGGIDIEEVARKTPEKIFKHHIDPILGMQMHEARSLAYKLYDNPKLVNQAAKIIQKVYETYMANDSSLAEINPLITTPDGKVLAIDAKINIDDNGLDRHPEIEAMRDMEAEDASEMEAKKAGLSFVKLEGNIGCIVNGAGLAMATMDLVKHFGGEPANFLDIGGSSNPEKVLNAMRIILRDSNVKAILFNIFGGITRCDDVANGIVSAVRELNPQVPIVIRLTGTNETEARKILEAVSLTAVSSMEDVVKTAIDKAGIAA
ncbi:MAG: ADP-forming succinate--CoA ligase subunit beta [candidate division Zixibacteria bacterium]|nr:ADP-forming succinate--CoA ligase subunit beta [candidate division Zixibacteria bacterium]NIR67846.1 ADP-forming succinate--CoA ligase subunit beta [candidate division Zixibacteria bacterium]NIS15542.1 ADP-forming succinate--CoA ligase subunit beta [candidate division Zixibacteria bacterium]NIS49072.1 ADP-forming succinate--CoA ligase subunit beta [candidate division Zixibacteria bacterium]NIT52067.1 ADP-forming succinate--CoA ligase subunit beta [candidate division Zixibacteria bacterium]